MAVGDLAMLKAFLTLTDDLVAGVGVDAYLRGLAVRAAELLDVRAVAVLLVGEDGTLNVAASSDELADQIARHEVTLNEGPGVDSFRSGLPVGCREMSVTQPGWPRFAPVAVGAGVAAAHALPCRRRDDVLGALMMYATGAGALSLADAELGRALANAVSLAVTTCRERELAVRADQLQHALHSRVVIEQAKGMLAERLGISTNEAFDLLRRHARANNAKIRDVARDVLTGTLAVNPRHQA
jgi:hypothetical protein